MVGVERVGAVAVTADAAEGMQAFLGRRPPEFGGE